MNDRIAIAEPVSARTRTLPALMRETDNKPAGVRPGDLVMPALINAHDHGYGVRTLDFGNADDALEAWIPGLRLRPRTDPYLEALVAFGRLAQAGVGSTMHCHNSLSADRLGDECAAVLRAAKAVGIRIGLSCPMLDIDAWAYGGGPERLKPFLALDAWDALLAGTARATPPVEQMAAVQAVAQAHGGEHVNVQYGPIGPQWCSNELLERIAEGSALHGRRIHMHLLESPRQRMWLDRRFPQGIVRYLDDIGFLSPRLAVAHGVQLRPEEYGLLADRGVQLVCNPSANLRLRSGIAPLAQAHARGLAFAVGLDGTGFDDDQDLWRELRLLWLLHGGRGLQRTLGAGQLWRNAVHNGARVVGLEQALQDRVIVDYARLIEDSLFPDMPEEELMLTRMTASHVRALIVNGREIARDGKLLTVDFDAARRELVAQARADLPRLEQARGQITLWSEAVRRYYATW